MKEHRHDLGRAALSGVAWNYASFGLTKALAFATTIVLARLLTPLDFGTVGFALVVIGYLELTRDLGVGPVLIARSEVSHHTASMGFIVSVCWGIVLATTLFLCAPLLGRFFW